jgi:hypothetical protein
MRDLLRRISRFMPQFALGQERGSPPALGSVQQDRQSKAGQPLNTEIRGGRK